MNARKVVMRILSISFTVLIVLLIVYGLYQTGLQSYDYGFRIFTEPAVTEGDGRDKLVQIKSSMSALELGALLEEKGLIRDKYLFVLQLKLSDYSDKLVPGHYTLNTSMTAQEMMAVLSGEDAEETDVDK